MKKPLLIASSIFLTLIILIAGGVLLAPSFIDFGTYKAQAQEQIKIKTGYDVAFDGDVSIGIFPAPHLSLKKVKVASPAGYTNANLASFESLDVNVALMPLLSGKIDVTGVNIVGPAIYLETAKNGRPNWMTPELEAMQKQNTPEGEAGSAAPENKSGGYKPEITLSNIEIEDGQVWYKAAGSEPVIVKDMNLDIDGESIKGPFKVEGSLHAMEQNLKIEASIGALKGKEEPLSVKAEGALKPANVKFVYAGAVDLKAMDTQGQADITFDKGNLKAMVTANQTQVKLDNMSLAYDQHKVSGTFSSTINPVSFSGNLVLDGTPASVSGTYNKDLTIALTAQEVNFDSVAGTKPPSPDKKETAAAEKPSTDDIKKQAANIKVPMTVNFNVVIANAIYNFQNIKDLKAKGTLSPNALKLENFSVGSIAGASVQAQGGVADLQNLAGIQAKISGAVNDMAAFAKFAKLDLSGLPPQVKSFAVNADLSGSLEALNTVASVKALDGTVTAKGVVQNPLGALAMKDLAVQIKHPNMNQALRIFNPSAPQYDSWSKPLDVSANIDMKDKVTSLSNIQASLAGTTGTGNLKIDGSAAKPAISGALEFGALSMRSNAAKPAGGSETVSAPAGTSNGGGKWSSAAIESAWLNAMNIDLDIKAKSLVYETWDLDAPEIDFVLKDGALDIKNLKAGLYGGQLAMNTQMKAVNADGKGLNIASDVSFDNVDLEKLAGSFIGTKIIKARGDADMTAKISGAGISQKALISSLSGQGSLNGKDIVMEGFDLARFARAMNTENKPGDTVLGLWKTSIKGGETQFDTMDGAYTVNGGVVNISKLDMDGPTALMQTTGNVNLPAWTVATKHSIQVKGTETPPFTLEISGPLDNPAQTFAQGAIQNYLNQKLERKLDKVLQDKLGVEAGDAPIEQKLFNKFLGDKLGVKQQAPTAANENTAPAQENTETVEPAAGEAPPAQQQEEEVTPEKAIEGVLKGLLQ